MLSFAFTLTQQTDDKSSRRALLGFLILCVCSLPLRPIDPRRSPSSPFHVKTIRQSPLPRNLTASSHVKFDFEIFSRVPDLWTVSSFLLFQSLSFHPSNSQPATPTSTLSRTTNSKLCCVTSPSMPREVAFAGLRKPFPHPLHARAKYPLPPKTH